MLYSPTKLLCCFRLPFVYSVARTIGNEAHADNRGLWLSSRPPIFDALRCIGIHMLQFTRFEIGELKTFILISCSKCHHHHKTATHHRSMHRNAMHSRLAKAEVSLTVCWWSAIAKTFICLQCAFCQLTVLLTENIQFLNHRTMPHISFIRRERHNEISSSEIHFRKLLNLVMHRNA